MSISKLGGGQSLTSSTAAPTSQRNVLELLLNDDRTIQLQSLSPEQLARLREYQGGVLGHIGEIQGGLGLFPLPSPPNPGPPQPSPQSVDPRELLRTQDPQAYAALSQLKPAEQKAFLQLVKDVGLEMPSRGGMFGGLLGRGKSIPHHLTPPPLPHGQKPGGIFGGMGQMGGPPPVPCQPIQPRINRDLLTLLKSGKLSKKDSKGKTLLQNLTSLSTQEMGPKLDRKDIFRQLCSHLADPGRITQGTHGTCAPTTIQHLQATRDPAEYARMIMGLTSKDGKVTMRNGDELKRDRGSLAPDGNTNRSTISRLYQSAVMEYANGEDEYDNRTDLHTQEDDSTYSGQANENSEKAMEALFGKDYRSMAVDRSTEAGRQRTERLLQEALNQGHQVPVAMEWSMNAQGERGYHMVAVVGMTEDSVVIRNPWGGTDNNENDATRGPDRQALDSGGTVEMSKQEFFARCYHIILPPEGKADASKRSSQ